MNISGRKMTCFDKSLKHELGPIKEPVSHVCLVDTVVAPWSLTPEAAGSNSFDDKYFQSLNSANSMKTFRENSNRPCLYSIVVYLALDW